MRARAFVGAAVPGCAARAGAADAACARRADGARRVVRARVDGGLARRQVLQMLLLSVAMPVPAHVHTAPLVAAAAAASGSDRVFFEVSVAGRPAGRFVVELFADAAPVSVDTFKKLVDGSLRNRSGRTAGYRYAQASRVIAGKHVELGRVKQIDALNQQPGIPQRQILTVQVPENRDSNQLSHDSKGLVSVQRGGSFEFSVLLAPDAELDESHLVIGRVVDGMNVIDVLGKVPTNRKTIRDGYRNIGRAIGDARAKVDVRYPVHPFLISCVSLWQHTTLFVLLTPLHVSPCFLSFCLSLASSWKTRYGFPRSFLSTACYVCTCLCT
ncbi:cyclophilin type peptidyl-prolyl cis-trans isomerase [Gracilaria domingensis]|nr:cyclophilin type peptidyl-prolyl cis-trans isomerase [Gracilaria domingensis]